VSDLLDAPGVVITDLTHAYDDADVLRNVSLSVKPGESLALLGPSGCGKTTLLRLIAGLERPNQGTIAIGGSIVASPQAWVPPERRRVGMVFQDWALFPHLSVEANVGYGLPRAERGGDRVQHGLDLVGLRDLGDRMPATLSGGQQQRIALARALAPEPSILLLDEPFSNLDTSLRVEVRTEVHRLLHELHITAVFVTHDQEEAFVLGDRVAVMRDGQVVQVDSPQDLYVRPVDREVAEFVGSGSIVAAVAAGGFADTPCGRLAVSIDDGEIDVLLRPEQLALATELTNERPTGTVDLVEYYGHDSMVVVRIDDHLLRVRCGPETRTQRGDAVGVEFVGDSAVAFTRA